MTLHSPWRLRCAAAALLAITAAVHMALVPEHLREAPYAGILFAGLSASALAAALGLLVRDRPGLWRVAAALSLGAIAGYVMSRSTGLPSMSDDVGEWLNSLGVAALCSEALTVLICARALRSSRRAIGGPLHHSPGSVP